VELYAPRVEPPHQVRTTSARMSMDITLRTDLLLADLLNFLDEQVGALLDELEKRDLLQSTVVVITSDHGDQFGEHNLEDHGNSLYMQTPVGHSDAARGLLRIPPIATATRVGASSPVLVSV